MTLHDALKKCEEEMARLNQDVLARPNLHFSPLPLPQRHQDVPADFLTVGLVGGTGVGKSSLINALAGRDISSASARRPTTSRVVPYLHEDRLEVLGRMSFLKPWLSDAMGTHTIESLRSMAIFDLPDIDSSRAEHARVVEEVLGGLDLIIWVTSLTKYNDREFHAWIAAHCSGRDLSNMIFVLNKIDTIQEEPKLDMAHKVRERFREAVMNTLRDTTLEGAEPVFFTTAASVATQCLPGNDFAALQDFIARERSLQEIQRIKSSDRLAQLRRQIEHMRRSVHFDERLKQLHEDIASVRDEVERLVATPDVSAELAERLSEGSAPEKAGAELFRAQLKHWPLLFHLRWLTSPFKQMQRAIAAARLLSRNDTQEDGPQHKSPFPHLMAGLIEIDRRRRDKASRSTRTLVAVNRDDEQHETLTRLRQLENECVLRMREGLRDLLKVDRTPGPWTRTLRRFLVWAPLLWFMLLQPLLEELLNPDNALESLPARMSWRLVRMFGATHLLVSAAFVVLVYLVYLVTMRARAHSRALSQCRHLLRSEWWTSTLLNSLTQHLTGGECREQAWLREESARLDELETSLAALEDLVVTTP